MDSRNISFHWEANHWEANFISSFKNPLLNSSGKMELKIMILIQETDQKLEEMV